MVVYKRLTEVNLAYGQSASLLEGSTRHGLGKTRNKKDTGPCVMLSRHLESSRGDRRQTDISNIVHDNCVTGERFRVVYHKKANPRT